MGKGSSGGGGSEDDGRRPAIERMGLFSEMGYLKQLSSDKREKKPQEAGKQFTTTPAKEGVYFSQYARAFQGEAYTDMVAIRRAYRREQSKRNLVPAGFRPSNVPPKASGKGSIYGTITQQYPLHDTGAPLPPGPDKTPPRAPELKNFVTSPPKKGGYGYLEPGTIGKPYPYMPSPYDRERELNVKASEESKKMRVDNKEFIGSVPIRPCFDLNPFAGTSPFTISPREPPTHIDTPWRPPNSTQPFLNSFPEYQPPNPHPPRADLEAAVRDQVATRKADNGTSSVERFKPVGTSCHSYPMRSIVEMNVPRAPSARLRTIVERLRSGNMSGSGGG